MLFLQFVVVDGLMIVALARSGAIKRVLKSFILLCRPNFRLPRIRLFRGVIKCEYNRDLEIPFSAPMALSLYHIPTHTEVA
jgi:hypothetical protein